MKASLAVAMCIVANVALVTIVPGCGKGPAPATVQAASAVTTTPVKIDLARKDLVFRYLDPSTGEVATAASLEAIPDAARRQVVVYDATVQLPAGWDLVADLAQGTTAMPRANFSFATRAALTPSAETPTAATDAGQHEVVMFSTEGCGYCAKARKFMTERRVPFTELDIEEDPAAARRLSALGQKAGLGQRDLQGVPIIFVDGTPILGWDQRRLSSLLGLGG